MRTLTASRLRRRLGVPRSRTPSVMDSTISSRLEMAGGLVLLYVDTIPSTSVETVSVTAGDCSVATAKSMQPLRGSMCHACERVCASVYVLVFLFLMDTRLHKYDSTCNAGKQFLKKTNFKVSGSQSLDGMSILHAESTDLKGTVRV